MRFYAGAVLIIGCVVWHTLADRPYAPAIYFASDTGDAYFHELMQEHEVRKNRKMIWEKVSQTPSKTSATAKRSVSCRTGA